VAAAVGQLLWARYSGVVAQAGPDSAVVALPHVVRVVDHAVEHNNRVVEGCGAGAPGQLC